MADKLKIVCFGGGTGLSTLLSGLKHNPRLDISAVVTMFDRGSSSGDLRDKFGVLPPSDIFRCILSLAPDEDQPTIRRIFNRRLADNHSPGNLFMFGADRVYGSYQQAVDELCKAFSVSGRLFPVATQASNLCAKFADGRVALKEPDVDHLMISEGGTVTELYLDPVVPANPQALAAIRDADVFCIGPGNLYTSVLPNFLPPGIREAVCASTAPVIFVLNLMTEGLGMKDWAASDIVRVLEGHIGRLVNAVIMNNSVPAELPVEYSLENKYPLTRMFNMPGNDFRYYNASLWLDGSLARHDPSLLSAVVWQVVHGLITL